MYPNSQTTNLPTFAVTFITSVLYLIYSLNVTSSQVFKPQSYNREWTSCNKELENANTSINSWAQLMREMIGDSVAPEEIAILEQERNIQNLIRRFSSQLHRKPIEQLVHNLVLIRRKSNNMALEIYMKNYDMRWPQTSVRLGATVERVQQACSSNLDRAVMLVLRPATVKSKRKQRNIAR